MPAIAPQKQLDLWATRNPNPFAPDCQDRSVGQFLRVVLKQLLDKRDALRRRDVRQPDKAAMGNIVYKDDLPEVLIDRHQDASLRRGPFEQRSIARIETTLATLHDILPLLAQPVGEAPTGTAIDQEPHCTCTASSESRAMTAWA